jgi:hypothetical protein
MAISTGAALLGSAALGVGGSIYAGSQAKKAGETQAAAAQRAGALGQQQFEMTREDLAPWREVGEQALYQYADLLGIPAPGAEGPVTPDYSQFETSPGYLFRQQEGIKAVERSQAAKGMLGSGATLKALERWGQGLASEEFGAYTNRLSSLAGLGQQTTVQTGQMGAQATGQQMNALQAAGQARASGYLGMGQAVQQGIGGVQQAGGYYAGMQQNQALIDALRGK